jgi:rhamnogalacturonan endolyase
VTLAEDADAYIMSNGIVTARIGKTGTLQSLRYQGMEMLGEGAAASNSNGYWSLPGSQLGFGAGRTSSVVTYTAARARVSIAYTYDGGEKTAPADVDLRYTLERGAQGLYLEAHWRHRAEYPELNFPVGRFAAKLNDELFDWMTVDGQRNFRLPTAYDWNHGTPLNVKEARRMTTGAMQGEVEHKYDYAAVQFDTPVYGWSSTARNAGLWLINPSEEYMGGGPTKLELSEHRDATFTNSLTAPAPPVLLNVWKGPHYGGTSLIVRKGEEWSKVIGPFLLYCDSGDSPLAMWKEAQERTALEQRRWPYEWAESADYPRFSQRGGVTGQLALADPQAEVKMTHALVGLTHPLYGEPNGATVDWQRDAKYYEYWVRADEKGQFKITARPGVYTLHAIADGVLGEYVKSNVTVTAGQSLSLGAIKWTPVRFGRQLWAIGVPDRTAGEFFHGDHYWTWGLYARYPQDFPNDVHYVIGKSDYRKDWNVMQVPRGDGSGRGRGAETTWTIEFDLADRPHGAATLRLALAGTECSTLKLAVNGIAIGPVTGLPDTGVIRRDADRGWWQERAVPFDATLMRGGVNTLALTVPAGSVTAGVEYDYLRLELDDREPRGRK